MPPARRNPSSTSSVPSTKGGFSPDATVASYKDVLLFEERLKQNAALLRSRKRKYEVFLAILCCTILVLTHKSFLRPSPTPSLHYLHLSLLPVAIVTLILFFASGMYAERIGYANRYVPHANRALRSLNMHLNMRVQPTPLIPYIPFPLSLLLPSTKPPPLPSRPLEKIASSPPSSRPSTPPLPSSTIKPNPSSPLRPTLSTASSSSSSTTIISPTTQASPSLKSPTPIKPIPHIPPTTNPRGELIFSSRVDRSFREGYERYRAMFEKRREERYRETRAGKKGLVGWWWWTLGYRRKKAVAAPIGGSAVAGVIGGGAAKRNGSPSSSLASSSAGSSSEKGMIGGSKGRRSRSPSPPAGLPPSSILATSTVTRTPAPISHTTSPSATSPTHNGNTINPRSSTAINPPHPVSSSSLTRSLSDQHTPQPAIPEDSEAALIPLDEALQERLRSLEKNRKRADSAADDRRNRAESFSFLLNGGVDSGGEEDH